MASSDSDSEWEDCREGPVRKRCKFNPQVNFEGNDFVEHFRLSRRGIEDLLRRIGVYLEPQTAQSHSLSGREKLLGALRFLPLVAFTT